MAVRYARTLIVDEHKARVGTRKGSLVVTSEQGMRVPIRSLDAVLITGGAQITTHAIAACAEQNVRVTGLSRNGRVKWHCSGPLGGNVMLHVAQVRSSDDPVTVLEIAKRLVLGKIRNSQAAAERWARNDDTGEIRHRGRRLEDSCVALADVADLDTLRGIEGSAARIHFGTLRRALRGDHAFTQRTRRPPRDPVNAALIWLYSLQVTLQAGACESVGLDPQIGFLHALRPGRPSLALDLIEEARPLIDHWFVRLWNRQQMTEADFESHARAVFLNDSGRRKLLTLWDEHRSETTWHSGLCVETPRSSLPSIQATIMARTIRGDIPIYLPHTELAMER